MDNKEMDLMELLLRVDSMLHRYYRHNHMGPNDPRNPHRGQGRILLLLKMQPEISQKDLSYLLDMRSQSLGEILAKLEKKGYITRTPSERDRRVMNIRLTPEGAKAADEAEGMQMETNQAFGCLREEERETLGELLKKLADSLEQQLADQNAPAFDMREHMHRHMQRGMGFHSGRPDHSHMPRRNNPDK